ncbi:MAG: fucosyltransferase [Thermosynechococcus sp.]|uniref:glycosyltransferase family 10 domain-containing protein n=1 Tax=Thermosynechococcus sp. TaxID=2814275 RepID=UPI002201DA17|nr:glycosyltransferase family 10 [Thermosynechococcus sp.]BCX12978.1 MAG: fucosyltransferase [Thermosynechococcus sp.]
MSAVSGFPSAALLGALSYSGGSAAAFLDASTRDGLSRPWLALRDALRAAGWELLAADDLHGRKPDFVIHVNVHATQHAVPTFAILTECGLVHPPNVDEHRLRRYQGVFTWMPELVEKGLAIKIQLAHPLGKGIVDGYGERPQLLVMIAANKALPVWRPAKDLYRERVRAIRWFERHAPEDFALYGPGWDLSPRLPTRLGGVIHRIERRLPRLVRWFPSWRGAIPAKAPVLERARFSLVYENVAGLRGYITEKIFDAFCAGNVPVYWGAEDVTDYIPEDCFIDRRRFASYADLYDHLRTMPEDRYLAYQRAIADFLQSEAAQRFSVEQFAGTVAGGIISVLKRYAP